VSKGKSPKKEEQEESSRNQQAKTTSRRRGPRTFSFPEMNQRAGKEPIDRATQRHEPIRRSTSQGGSKELTSEFASPKNQSAGSA